MQPHQERVIAEHRELKERAGKLAAFVFGPDFVKVPGPESLRLGAQLSIMHGYAAILEMRIAAFPPDNENQPTNQPT